MPVSSPSYFPPSRGTDQIVGITAGRSQTGARVFLAGQSAGDNTTISDLILIGDQVLKTGVTEAGMSGMTIIGSQAAVNVKTTENNFQAFRGPSTVYGFKALGASLTSTNNTVIGSHAIDSWVSNTGNPVANNVVIGEQAGANLGPAADPSSGYAQNVCVGFGAGSAFATSGATQFKNFHDNVVIGYRAISNLRGLAPSDGQTFSNVVIGFAAGISMGALDTFTSNNSNVVIGAGADAPGNSKNNVYVGTGAGAQEQNTSNQNVGIGANNITVGVSSNVVIGYGAANDQGNNLCVIIGKGATLASGDNQFLIENYDGVGNQFSILYGRMENANVFASHTGLVVGGSKTTNRDLPGNNMLKLLNGARGVGNPLGGGCFYVIAGALHWLGSAGTDTVIAPA